MRPDTLIESETHYMAKIIDFKTRATLVDLPTKATPRVMKLYPTSNDRLLVIAATSFGMANIVAPILKAKRKRKTA